MKTFEGETFQPVVAIGKKCQVVTQKTMKTMKCQQTMKTTKKTMKRKCKADNEASGLGLYMPTGLYAKKGSPGLKLPSAGLQELGLRPHN